MLITALSSSEEFLLNIVITHRGVGSAEYSVCSWGKGAVPRVLSFEWPRHEFVGKQLPVSAVR